MGNVWIALTFEYRNLYMKINKLFEKVEIVRVFLQYSVDMFVDVTHQKCSEENKKHQKIMFKTSCCLSQPPWGYRNTLTRCLCSSKASQQQVATTVDSRLRDLFVWEIIPTTTLHMHTQTHTYTCVEHYCLDVCF